MTSRSFRFLAASLSLALWLAMLLSPWMLIPSEDRAALAEIEHNEQESEGEEWQAEWEESVLNRLTESMTHRVHWSTAHSHNVELHERLDSSRLLDPPDA